MQITGAGELRRVAAQLRTEHRNRQRNFNATLRAPVRQFDTAIRAEVGAHVPRRYAGVLGAALKITIGVRATGVRLFIRAFGHKSQRDVDAVNRGILRHKLFGMTFWYAQRVRAGFVDDPVAAMADDVYRGLERAADEIRQRIERG
jgi:hypothetical protein